ncbi:helix-turn-helix domain-containing protein [Mesorhizobium sp. BHbdii]
MRRQLARLFAKHIGVSPVKYYLKLRVDYAKRLIEGTRLPLVDTRIASGVVSKCFRKIHGVSPQQFRLTVPAWVGRGIGCCDRYRPSDAPTRRAYR